MSQLRSAIDAFRVDELAGLPDARVEEDFAELQRACELIEVERLRRLAELDRRGVGECDGHLSTASWLTVTHRIARGLAQREVKTARALESMSETRRALDDGQISISAARLLVDARDAAPEVFEQSESDLVEAARVQTVDGLRRITAFWRERIDREHARDSEERLRERRSFHASRTFLGMVRVDGDLDPETGRRS